MSNDFLNPGLSSLGQHVLLDGFKIVVDLQHSRGSHLVDAGSGRTLLDLYGFYGSLPLGFNHPYFETPPVREALYEAARIKVANSDVYSEHYIRFVETFSRVMGLPPLERYFFIEGGALAVENALKAAMDWKVRKNLAGGKGERGTEILHFQRAFHGRSGYTLALPIPIRARLITSQVLLAARFNSITGLFPAGAERHREVESAEKRSEAEIRKVLEARGDDVAAIIIETIQGEGGDNHFRGEWLRKLRAIADEHDVLLIFDEVQCGMGATGRNWCCEHFDVLPDLLVFGKKAQVCGVMAGPRLDEVKDNCFRLPAANQLNLGRQSLRLCSRSRFCLEEIERDKLVQNARAKSGEYLFTGLARIAEGTPQYFWQFAAVV